MYIDKKGMIKQSRILTEFIERNIKDDEQLSLHVQLFRKNTYPNAQLNMYDYLEKYHSGQPGYDEAMNAVNFLFHDDLYRYDVMIMFVFMMFETLTEKKRFIPVKPLDEKEY